MLQQLRWRAEYVCFRLIACVVEILSVRQTVRVAHRLAWVMTRMLPKKWTRYHIAYDNLRLAFEDRYSPAEIDDLIRRMWVHLFRLVAEVVQFPRKLRLENCREVVVFRNRRAAVKALTSGRRVLILGGHFGNWEASMSTFGVFGFRQGFVARALDNPHLHRWFTRTRERTGHQLLLKSGGWDDMVELLEAGGQIGLLGDQDAGRRGIFVDFFGRPASTFRSIALMALQYDALIIVGYGRRLPDDFDESRWVRYEIGCEEVIDPRQIESDDEVQEITERYTQALQRAIERSPEQYFWVHRRWKSEPGQKRRRKSRSKAA